MKASTFEKSMLKETESTKDALRTKLMQRVDEKHTMKYLVDK